MDVTKVPLLWFYNWCSERMALVSRSLQDRPERKKLLPVSTLNQPVDELFATLREDLTQARRQLYFVKRSPVGIFKSARQTC